MAVADPQSHHQTNQASSSRSTTSQQVPLTAEALHELPDESGSFYGRRRFLEAMPPPVGANGARYQPDERADEMYTTLCRYVHTIIEKP